MSDDSMYRIGTRKSHALFPQFPIADFPTRQKKNPRIAVDTSNNHAGSLYRKARFARSAGNGNPSSVPSPAPLIAVFCRLFSRALCSALPLPVSLPAPARIGSGIGLTYNVARAICSLSLSLSLCLSVSLYVQLHTWVDKVASRCRRRDVVILH